ncbi:hypothetical protein HK102_006813 [Quaeritorhiza haematococci]|nr:hypothetical protein HK102_006813 [Quaeritorhiza haematococci]
MPLTAATCTLRTRISLVILPILSPSTSFSPVVLTKTGSAPHHPHTFFTSVARHNSRYDQHSSRIEKEEKETNTSSSSSSWWIPAVNFQPAKQRLGSIVSTFNDVVSTAASVGAATMASLSLARGGGGGGTAVEGGFGNGGQGNGGLLKSEIVDQKHSVGDAKGSSVGPSRASWSKAHVGMIFGPRFRAPRSPVVLCHGLFGFDVLAETLRKDNCDIHVARVSPVASVQTRAQQLQRFLATHMAGRGVNLVAHSMGGLDCRYLITHLKPKEFQVLSLTTIGTPHRGSPFMDWCRDAFGVGYHDREPNDPQSPQQSFNDVMEKVKDAAAASNSNQPLPSPQTRWTIQNQPHHTDTQTHIESTQYARRTTSFLYRNVLNLLDAPAFSNLTTDYCRDVFNPSTPNDPQVYYASYAAVTDVPVYMPLHFAYQIIRRAEGPNDGLVSLESAKWGELVGVVECDHWDLIPKVWNRVPIKPTSSFNPTDFYRDVVTKLYDQGF